MNTLKFTVWDIDKKKNAPEDICRIHFNQGIPYGITLWDDGGIFNFKLLPFTFAHDKNKTELYLGDIVKKDTPCYWKSAGGDFEPDGEDQKYNRGGTGVIIQGAFGFTIKSITAGKWAFEGPDGSTWLEDEIELVGNIYENPELGPHE